MRFLCAFVALALLQAALSGCRNQEQMVRDADGANRYSAPRTVSTDLLGYEAKGKWVDP